jgi:small subunit ribosomal protein S6
MKIPADKTTRSYELTYLVPPTYSESERSSINDAVTKVLDKYQVEVQNTEDWGKRELAYSIRHGSQAQDEAYYTHIVFVADPDNVQELEKEIYLIDEIMRHLLVVAEE